ncbi:glycoside hydrolase family 45 protein [Sodiomyces alcalophilus JCM 7366]|uniref:glycoside hydrolase family 45 protein n=1 Tax=Sodiomyces alcalophilus JCM 7366 TaxID=591952 RepID=UPI0039B68043
MRSSIPLAALLPLVTPYVAWLASAQASGTGGTTRYWDCCKPSCSWPGNAPGADNPVGTCDVNDNPLHDGGSTTSGCEEGGSAYMCSSHGPWAVSEELAYGWAAVRIAGGDEAGWCCACYELTFTSGPVAGKKMVVQATNTGADLGDNHFDIAIPGGGVGIFNACTDQWNAPADGWGERYGGVSSRQECEQLPAALQDGCFWRFDWFGGADNPDVEFTQVSCPSEITSRSGCRRHDD